MDDLTSKLHGILNDPESLEKLKNMASMLGVSGTPDAGPKPAEPACGQSPAPAPYSADIDAIKMAAKFAPIMSCFKKENDSTRLLRALRPFLSDKRKSKLDESIKLMQIIKIIPLIKKAGIL
ncbi:MAG TPA: hypothetical protein DIV41_01055 [Ruminococcaceae bacterium]|jgi:hypothetical protein|nr:hypothetical protein [Oscillospiraceae bacterium]